MLNFRGTTVPLDSLRPFKARDHSFRYRLTPAEREVARLLLDYASTREIAVARGVSVKTIQGAISNIIGKLGVSNRVEALPLLRKAMACGTRTLRDVQGSDGAWISGS